MKNKLKTSGIIILSMVGMILLFIAIIGIGNYFQGIDQKIIGNLFMGLFPMAVYFAVKIFNSKVNGLNNKKFGFGFKEFIFNYFSGIGLAIGIMSLVFLIAKLMFGIDFVFSGLKNDFQEPLLSLLLTLLIVGVWEEFYFRGLVFNTLLKNNFGFHLSAFISSVLFSIIHWSSFDMTETSWLWYIGIVFIGYILVYIYVYSGSIWSVVSFHFVWNFIAILMDNSENEIGLFEVSNYLEHSKLIDNITVVCLGILLFTILILDKRIGGSKRIKSYIDEVTAADTVYK